MRPAPLRRIEQVGGEEIGQHALAIGFAPGEMPERLAGLAHDHRRSANGAKAALLGGLDQLGLAREIDDVGQPLMSFEKRRIEWHAGMGLHADRGGLDNAIRAGDRIGRIVCHSDAGERECGCQADCKLRRPCRRSVGKA